MFAVYLPLMIGHKVPENDEMWECYLLLLDILKLCTSRVQSPDLVAFLEVLISDHHHSFAHCYPGSSITPKLHYCIHLPSQILRYVHACVHINSTYES